MWFFPDSKQLESARAYTDTAGVQRPEKFLYGPLKELAATGVRRFTEQPPPAGMRACGPCIDTDTGTEIIRTWPQVEPDPQYLAQSIAHLCMQINDLRKEYLYGSIVFNGHEFSVDQAARTTLREIQTRLNAGQALPDSFAWRATDNSMIPMNTQELQGFIELLYSWTMDIYNISWAKKDSLRACTELAQLHSLQEADIVHTGWPAREIAAHRQ